MMPLLRGELLKVRTTRTAFGFGAASVLLVVAYVLVSMLADEPRSVEAQRDAFNVGGVLSVPLLLFGIVGATGEYRHRTLAPAALIAPGRTRLTLARLLAYSITALLVGVAMLAAALAIGIPLLPSDAADLAGSDYRSVIAGGLLAAVLSTAFGVGVGILVRNQVASVVGMLVWLFILAPLLSLIGDQLSEYTTLAAAARVGGSTGPELSYETALLVLFAWPAVFITAGLLVDHRRDIE
jgi:ABC-2 type transport system permease protein